MTAKLFLGNLPYTVTEDEIEELFRNAGYVRGNTEQPGDGIAAIASIRVVRDRDTGLSKGFGFVEMHERGDAEQARDYLVGNHAELNGREIVVDLARPGAGGGGGRGGRR